MNQEEKINRLRLFRSENVGAVTFRVLMEHFKTAEKALSALPEKARKGGLRKPLKICSRAEAEKEFEDIQKAGAEFIFRAKTLIPNSWQSCPTRRPSCRSWGTKPC